MFLFSNLFTLAVIGLVILLAMPVAILVLFSRTARLSGEVRALERRISRLTDAPAQPVAASAPPDAPIAARVAAEDRAPAKPTAPPPLPPLPPQPPQPPRTPPAPLPSAAVVFTPARFDALAAWLRANWIYAVSALSLALAGVFFVQYGMERGLLPPGLRVLSALVFGAALVAAGEWVRRRSGDGRGAASAYIPSTFAGAGIVSMFGAVIAARGLYGLIGSEAAFAGLLAVAALALALGWVYGPFLAAAGLIGAGAAPFLVGGDSADPTWLYAYFALVGAVGLGVDAVRRWAWVSVLALAVAYGGIALIWFGTGGPDGSPLGQPLLAAVLLAVAVGATLIPGLALRPDHAGPALSATVFGKGGAPVFPVRLAVGAGVASSIGLALIQGAAPSDSWAAYLALAALAGFFLWAAGSAPGLRDLALLPAAAFLGRLGLEGAGNGPLAEVMRAAWIGLRPPETSPPPDLTLLLALAGLMTLGAALRAGTLGAETPGAGTPGAETLGAPARRWMALGAAVFAPLAAGALELWWRPALSLGAYGWALHVLAVAALMTALAVQAARADGEDRARAALYALSALTLIAFSFAIALSGAALTLALAALAVFAAALDRQFRMVEMGWFLQAATVVLGYRLVVDPGLFWAVEVASLPEAVLATAGVAAALYAALRLLPDRDGQRAQVALVLESGALAALAVAADVLLLRVLIDKQETETNDWFRTHWGMSLVALPWLVSAFVQIYRRGAGGAFVRVRAVLAGLAAALWAPGMAFALTIFSPLVPLFGSSGARVYGPPVLDTLAVAYGLPALILFAGVRLVPIPRRFLRRSALGAGFALLAVYVVFEIRRFWQGDDLSVPGVVQGELYSYTVALMLLGAGLLYQAIARGSSDLRRVAMAVIGVTIAKVFLWDAAGLTGLTRVASFVGLGLALAGLAWLNRWAAGQGGHDKV